MSTNINQKQEPITLDQAQELIINRQTDIMQEVEKFTNDLVQLQENEDKSFITQDDQNQADGLLNNL